MPRNLLPFLPKGGIIIFLPFCRCRQQTGSGRAIAEMAEGQAVSSLSPWYDVKEAVKKMAWVRGGYSGSAMGKALKKLWIDKG